jgi:hypothetical protein
LEKSVSPVEAFVTTIVGSPRGFCLVSFGSEHVRSGIESTAFAGSVLVGFGELKPPEKMKPTTSEIAVKPLPAIVSRLF